MTLAAEENLEEIDFVAEENGGSRLGNKGNREGANLVAEENSEENWTLR